MPSFFSIILILSGETDGAMITSTNCLSIIVFAVFACNYSLKAIMPPYGDVGAVA